MIERSEDSVSVGVEKSVNVYIWGIVGHCGHGDTERGSSGGWKSALKARNRPALTQPRRLKVTKADA